MHFDIRIDGERTVSVQGDLTPQPNELMAVVIDGVRQKVALVADGDTYHVFINRHRHLLDHHTTQHDAETLDAGQGSLAAPMPGKIISVLVEQGQSVNRGAPLMVLEAMKMEHTINAPIDGKVTEVHFKQGDLVEENAELAVVTPH
jgi:3-methylcrotonyl-CoA carboxylase alpha subunit